MGKTIIIILLFTLKSFYCSYYQYFDLCDTIPEDSNLNILTTLKGKVRGECLKVPVSFSNGSTQTNDVFRWLSIPYAKPLLNENRFKNPLPVDPWTNIINGTVWPKRCMQILKESDVPMSEDCLQLNIFVSADSYLNRGKRLSPILFFIHGGSFIKGGASDDAYEGSTLASMTGLIIITINYRVGALGFLHLDDTIANGNQGFLDSNLALQWASENAHTFGGDKSKITLCGQSAGSWLVNYHLYYPKSWPYFRNAIMQSGSATYKGLLSIQIFKLKYKQTKYNEELNFKLYLVISKKSFRY